VFTTAREMKYSSQHCCDKTMDGKVALYREWCSPNCTKIIVNTVTFVGFRGSITPWNRPAIRALSNDRTPQLLMEIYIVNDTKVFRA